MYQWLLREILCWNGNIQCVFTQSIDWQVTCLRSCLHHFIRYREISNTQFKKWMFYAYMISIVLWFWFMVSTLSLKPPFWWKEIPVGTHQTLEPVPLGSYVHIVNPPTRWRLLLPSRPTVLAALAHLPPYLPGGWCPPLDFIINMHTLIQVFNFKILIFTCTVRYHRTFKFCKLYLQNKFSFLS